MQSDLDLMVVTRRIAADHDRARTERLARQSRTPSSGRGPRAWIGRRLIGLGTQLAGDPPRIERPSGAGRPC